MTNLDPGSPLMWTHILLPILFLFLCICIMWNFSSHLKIYAKNHSIKRTLMISNIKPKDRSINSLQDYFRHSHPMYPVQDIRLVYNVRRLISLNRKLELAKEAKKYCDDLYRNEQKEIIVKTKCWFCYYLLHCHYSCKTVEGRKFYSEQVENLKKAIEKEMQIIIKNPLGIAFVTFKEEDHSTAAKAHEGELTRLTLTDRRISRKWKVAHASSPKNIIWENLSISRSKKCLDMVIVNTFTILVAFFLTTPTIIVSSIELLDYSKASKVTDLITSEFLPSFYLWILSVCLPALVSYSDQFLHYNIRSVLCRSIMSKTFIYLVFMVIILPSLGFTSVNSFFNWAITRSDETYKWECIFLPDKGAFFVNYIITSGMTGSIIELLHIPEIVWFLFCLCKAKSEAEKGSIRKEALCEYNFGVQYAWFLLIFTLVIFYCIPCPVITPFGLLYLCIKHWVDRYNIFFAYSPTTVSHKVHALAIDFVMLALILENAGIFFLSYLRTGWNKKTTASVGGFLFTSIFCSIQMSYFPFCRCAPEFFTLPHLKAAKKDFNKDRQEMRSSQCYAPDILNNLANIEDSVPLSLNENILNMY